MKVIRLYITTVCLHSTKKPQASFLVSQSLFETLRSGLDLDGFKG